MFDPVIIKRSELSLFAAFVKYFYPHESLLSVRVMFEVTDPWRCQFDSFVLFLCVGGLVGVTQREVMNLLSDAFFVPVRVVFFLQAAS